MSRRVLFFLAIIPFLLGTGFVCHDGEGEGGGVDELEDVEEGGTADDFQEVTEYCLYWVSVGSDELGIEGGDVICVDCPDDEECPGPVGTDLLYIKIRNRDGTEGRVRVRKQEEACTECPPNGITGYEFVEE